MKSFLDNLFLYEIVLLFLGVFLFMLPCAGLVYFIIKNHDLKKHPILPEETSRLKEQINKIPWSNPKTKEYLNRKIIRQNIKTDTIKS